MYEAGGRFVDMPRCCDMPEFPVPAYGGRFAEVLRDPFIELMEVFGRFELPNPCGARPESVEFPCAFQVRADRTLFVAVAPPGREELNVELFPALFPGCVA